MINKLKNVYLDYKDKNEDATYISFFFYTIRSFIRLLSAKIYLRNCQKVGKYVSVNQKPLLINKGIIFIADDVKIWSSINRAKIFVEKNGLLTIGKNTHINGCHISCSLNITIGQNVRIGPYSIIIDDDYHDINDHFANKSKKGAIVIEDNVWITMNCTIMKGVTIGKGSVIAMGSLVNKDVPPYTVVAGVPARVVKELVPVEKS